MMENKEISLDLILHDDVQKLLDVFASVIHAKVVLYGPDGKVLKRGRSEGNSRFCQMIQQKNSLETCLRLDQKMQSCAQKSCSCESYICHAGLREAVMPVRAGMEFLGYVVFGQFRQSDRLPAEISKHFPDKREKRELEKAFLELPLLSAAEMQNLTEMMRMLVDYIVRCELITQNSELLYSAILRYIDEHLTESVTLKQMSKKLGRSVSLISHFLSRKGISFKQLQIEKRLLLAEKMMKENPARTIKEIADQTGFRDPYYFSRIYRKYRGFSPSRFKRF